VYLSKALDFAKQGESVNYDGIKKLKFIEKFPHYFEREDPNATYHSKKVLGLLYDQIINISKDSINKIRIDEATKK
jgi:hypothetical protein